MKNLRIVAGLALCLCAMLLFLPGRAAAADGGAFGDGFSWSLDDAGVLTLSGSGPMPDYEDATQVPWYASLDGILSVEIGDGVTSLGSFAFSGCENLTGVSLPDSVVSIGASAFEGCCALTGITLPAGVVSIGEYSFFDCAGLTAIAIPDGVVSIGTGAFQGCAGLTEVAIPGGVTAVADYAFEDCAGLVTVTIPDGVTAIGESAFDGCAALTGVTLPYGVTDIGVDAFARCEHLTAVTIPESVVSIGDGAFQSCVRLTGIQIPDSVTELGGYAFQDCRRLTGVTLPDGLAAIPDYLFAFCTSLTGVSIPDSVASIGESAFRGCTALAALTIPDGVTDVGSWAFCDCTALTALTIPGSVTDVGSWAFQGCTGLTAFTVNASNECYSSLGGVLYNKTGTELLRFPCGRSGAYVIPDTVTAIGDYAFQGCAGLTDVAVPGGVTAIGIGVFEDCTGLTGVALPDGVTAIGTDAFFGCDHLVFICLPDTIASIGAGAFSYCDSLTTVYYGGTDEQWQAIGILSPEDSLSSAARYCPENTGICGTALRWTLYGDGTLFVSGSGPIPDYEDVTSAPWHDFGDSIHAVIVGFGVTRLGSFAFSDCGELASLTIPGSVTSIGDYTLAFCDSLTGVVIPETLASLGPGAFAFCSGLDVVTIPAGLTSIGTGAFSGCTGLTKISVRTSNPCYKSLSGVLFNKSGTELLQFPAGKTGTYIVPGGVACIREDAFYGCAGLTALTIPLSMEYIADAFSGCSGLARVYYGGSCVQWASISSDADLLSVTVYCTHEYGEPVWQWSADGTAADAVFTCTRGDDTRTVAASVTPAGGVEATCTESGTANYTGTVTFEDVTYTDSHQHVLPALGHDWGEWETVVAPACTEEGSEQRTCSRCGETETHDLEALGHDYTETVTEPTCDQQGFTTHVCSRCGDSCVDSFTDALGHDWGEWETVVAPSCTEEGSEQRTCSRCGETETRVLEALGHEPGEPVRENEAEPTVNEEGGYDEVIFCRRCGAELSRDHVTVPALTPEGPEITLQPVDYVGAEGSTAAFTIAAEGEGPLTYQWWIRNPGENEFTKSTRRTATYTTTLRAASSGRELYCVVTDSNGSSVQSDVVTMTIDPAANAPRITLQPVDYVGAEGSTAAFTIAAEGEGPLTYQWWIRNPGENEFTKSTRRTATYTTTLRAASSGRELYCVVTDSYGSSVQSDVVTMTIDPAANAPRITLQPVDYAGAEGSTAAFTIAAEGAEPLTYQWWIRNPGETEFKKSTRRTATYTTTLKAASSGRELYCVVTDANGSSVRTDTVTMTIRVPLTITLQPVDYAGPEGSTAAFTMAAQGEGPLTYQWWIRNPGETEFTKSTRRTATYTTTLKAASSGRELYCVVTDASGDTVTTDTVTMTIEHASVSPLITLQPEDYVGAEGSTVSISLRVEGNGPFTYRWWIRNPGEEEFSLSTRRTATYSTTLKAASNGRELYCVVTDAEGNTAQTDTVTMTIG